MQWNVKRFLPIFTTEGGVKGKAEIGSAAIVSSEGDSGGDWSASADRNNRCLENCIMVIRISDHNLWIMKIFRRQISYVMLVKKNSEPKIWLLSILLFSNVNHFF